MIGEFFVKITAKLILNVARHGWARENIFHSILLKTALNSILNSLYRKRWLSVKKDDRSSHQLSINVPNFNANKGVHVSLDIWRSRKAVKCLSQNISLSLKHHKLDSDITRTESETKPNKRKVCISPRSKRKLIHDPD